MGKGKNLFKFYNFTLGISIDFCRARTRKDLWEKNLRPTLFIAWNGNWYFECSLFYGHFHYYVQQNKIKEREIHT